MKAAHGALDGPREILLNEVDVEADGAELGLLVGFDEEAAVIDATSNKAMPALAVRLNVKGIRGLRSHIAP